MTVSGAPGNRTTRGARVLVADYSSLFRSGMRRAIETEPGLEVVGEASDVEEISSLAARASPDVLVVGTVASRPTPWREICACAAPQAHEGEERREGAREGLRAPAIVAVVDLAAGARRAFEAVFEAVGAGALGWVDRGVGAEDLVHAVRAASKGRHFASSEVLKVLVNELTRLNEVASGFEAAVSRALESSAAGASRQTQGLVGRLTPRECEVVSLVACGKSNREIGRVLCISEKTVKNHVGHILRKLGTGRRTQAALWAVSHGLASALGKKAQD